VVSRPPPLPPIRGLEPVSLTAWEGKVVAVVQLQGCNFKCPDCPVPHLVPQVFEGGTIPIESALEAIHRRRRWLDAVVVAGGEPTLHEGLGDFVRLVRELGLPVRLHTNGSRPEELRDVLETGEVGSVSMTVRGPLDPTYAVAVGARVRLAAVYESVELLLHWPGEHEFRVPWLPQVVEQTQMISVLRMLAGARRVVLDASADGKPGLRTLQQVARAAGPYVDSCVIAARPGQDFGARARSRSISSRDGS
jgi:pyruvate formate lyase activating enzyme